MPSLAKNYTYASDNPWAMSGGMDGSFPSASPTQPGGTVPGVRAPSPFSAMTAGPYGGGMLNMFKPPASGVQEIDDPLGRGRGGMTPSAMLSPYEPEYRDTARGWEGLRSTLASNLQALASPQAYASAGLPTSYWKKKSDERLGDLNAGVDAKRADIEARYRRGAINSAQRLQEMEDLERDAAQQRGQTAAGMDTARVEQGMQAVGQSAGILGSLYGNVPVASAPQMLPLSAGYNDILSAGGGLSGGKSSAQDIANQLRGEGYSDINQVPDEVRKTYGLPARDLGMSASTTSGQTWNG